MRLVSDEPGAAGEQGDLVSRLRAVIGAKDEQIAALTAALEASLAAAKGGSGGGEVRGKGEVTRTTKKAPAKKAAAKKSTAKKSSSTSKKAAARKAS